MRRATTAFAVGFLACRLLAADRTFVHSSSDGSQTEIGTNAVAGARARSIHFSLVQMEMDRWPSPTTVVIRELTTFSTWRVPLAPRVAIKPHTLKAPDGTYELTFTVPHYRSIQRVVRLDRDDVELGRLAMSRYPVLSGTIRLADRSPVVGALVIGGPQQSSKTDGLGGFSLEIDRDWPSRLQVSYPGLTTKEILVPKAKASSVFPPVILSKGSQLTVLVEGAHDDVDIDLAIETGYKKTTVMKHVGVRKQSPRAVFTDLEKGSYIVVVRGEKPLQRVATMVEVAEAESATKTIRIQPLSLQMRVVRGDAPVPGAMVTVQADGNRWSSEVRAGVEGTVTHEVWERGSYVFAVRATETSVPVLLLKDIAGMTEASITLDVPDRRLSGRITDTETGSPLPKAVVGIESRNDDDTGSVIKAVTDGEGKFVVEGLRDGSHTVVADADGYIRPEPTTVRIDQASPAREVDLKMSRGTSHLVRVATSDGIPIPRAFVVEMLNEQAIGTFKTDDLGRGVVHAPAGRSVILYVIPEEDSFAIRRLPSTPDREEETIVVQPGAAVLELHAATNDGNPIAGIRFMMRFDGEIIPPDVAEVLEIQRGIAAVTSANGVARLERLPRGFLELWPIRSEREARDISAAGAAAAPVQVSLKDGVNVATMTFAPRR